MRHSRKESSRQDWRHLCCQRQRTLSPREGAFSSGLVNPVESKLHQLVEAQAKRTPTTVAIEFEDQYLTYAQLNSKTNRLARLLSQQGVGPDSIAAVCFERGIPQILAILAILGAGGAFLPLDPDDPTLRKEMLIVDTNAKILLTTYSKRRDFDKALASKVIVSVPSKWKSFGG